MSKNEKRQISYKVKGEGYSQLANNVKKLTEELLKETKALSELSKQGHEIETVYSNVSNALAQTTQSLKKYQKLQRENREDIKADKTIHNIYSDVKSVFAGGGGSISISEKLFDGLNANEKKEFQSLIKQFNKATNNKTLAQAEDFTSRARNRPITSKAYLRNSLSRKKRVDLLESMHPLEQETAILNNEIKRQKIKGEYNPYGKTALKYGYSTNEGFREMRERLASNLKNRQNFAGRSARFLGRTLGYDLDAPNVTAILGYGAAAGIAALARGISGLGKEAITAAKEIESLKTGLEVVYGSQSTSDKAFAEMAEYATRSPYGITKMVEYGTLMRQSGIYSSKVMEAIKMVGDTAGGNEEKMQRIATNYAQVVSQNRATSMDLRQFAMAGIPIYKEIAKELGIEVSQVRKRTEEGKITADVIENVFKRMTSEGGIFENATEKGAKTLKARMINLKDTKTLALSEVGSWLLNIGQGLGPEGKTTLFTKFLSKIEELVGGLGSAFKFLNIYGDASAAKRGARNIYRQKKKQQEQVSAVALSGGAVSTMVETEARKKKLQTAESIATTELRKTLGDKGRRKLEKATNDLAAITQELVFYENLRKEGKTLSVIEGGVTRDLSQNEFDSRQSQLKKWKNAAEESLKKQKESLEYFYYIQQELASAVLKYSDQVQEAIERSSSSLTKRSARLDELYKSTDAYKQEQEKEEKDFLEKLKADLARNKRLGVSWTSLMFDGNENWLSSTKTPLGFYASVVENLERKGDYNVEAEKITKEDVRGISGNINALESAVNHFYEKTENQDLAKLSTALTKLSEGLESETLITADLNTVIKSSDGIDIKKRDLIASLLGEFTDSVKGLDKDSQLFAQLLFQNIGDSEFNEKRVNELLKEQSEKNPVPLWKRIMSEQFSVPVGMIKTADKFFDEDYKALGARRFSTEIINAIISSSGAKSAYNLLNFKDASKNEQGTPQINWNSTRDNIAAYSMSKQAKTSEVSAYVEGLKKEKEMWESFVSAVITQGEDLSLIFGKDGKDFLKKLGYSSEMAAALFNAWGDGEKTVEYAKQQAELTKNAYNLARSFELLRTTVDGIEKSTKNTEGEYKLLLAGRKELFNLGSSQRSQFLEYLKGRAEINGTTLSAEISASKGNNWTDVINPLKAEQQAQLGLQSLKALEFLLQGNKEKADRSYNSLGITGSLSDITNAFLSGENGLITGLAFKEMMKESKGVFSLTGSIYGGEKNAEKFESLLGTNPEKAIDLFLKMADAVKEVSDSINTLGEGIRSTLESSSVNFVTNSFVSLGKSIKSGSSAIESMGENFANYVAQLSNGVGQQMVSAGLSNLMRGNTALGLALIAGGGGLGMLSGYFSEKDNEDDNLDKLQTLKDMLAELLKQARTDAEYYSRNSRHKQAIANNESLSIMTSSVNDAVISPSGKIITTHPDDFLIATKTPETLGKSASSAPVVNFTLVNESGQQLNVEKTETKQTSNGFDIKAFVVAVTQEAAAKGQLDGAFAAMQARQLGRRVSS